MTKILKQFWTKVKLTTSETSTPLDTIYKLGSIVTISSTEIILRISISGEDKESIGRWLYITIGGINNYCAIIIIAYRP